MFEGDVSVMNTHLIVLIVLLVIAAGVFIALYIMGKRLEKQRDEQQARIAESAQQVSMLIIDKKRMKLKDSGLPEMVIAQTPWYAKRGKVPVVKGKVGPQIMNFIAAEEIFDELPVKKEVKATVSGLYISGVRGLHGKLEKDTTKKKSWRVRMLEKADKMRASVKEPGTVQRTK